MISKTQQNMAILDNEIMNEMPKNLSLDNKVNNCDKSNTTPPQQKEDNTNLKNDLSDNCSKNQNNNVNSDLKSNDYSSEIKIPHLSFSVDRLLSDKLQLSKRSPPHLHDQHTGDKCCNDLNASYSCCSLPNCLLNSTSTNSMLPFPGSSYQSADEEMPSSPASNFMDFKSIVRPTPVRAMGNSSDSVPSLAHFSSLPPTALIRFHHAHMQQQQQQKPLSPNFPAQANFSLSSIINPLCNLKPLQLSPQQIGLPNFCSNRFNTKVNFDIPIVRPNLNCITSLRHHMTPSNESHNSNSTTSVNTTSTATSNTNSGNSHGNLSSGGKRKRSWSRAVFSNLQRKGLEIQFQQQKYITKPDRRKLAARLNLTDAQVKVWFQNRRMKWRHTRENLKSGQEKQPTEVSKSSPDNAVGADLPGYSSDGSSSLEMSDVEDEDDDEIDVVE